MYLQQQVHNYCSPPPDLREIRGRRNFFFKTKFFQREKLYTSTRAPSKTRNDIE